MRWVLVLALAFSASSITAQSDLWAGVSTTFDRPELASAELTPARSKSLAMALRRAGAGEWPCAGNLNDLITGLIYHSIPLSEAHDTFLVEAGMGCARGGQGANGAMWIVRFRNETPEFLAGPKNQFNGWLFSIQPTLSHGYRDIVLGWHMSGFETALSYFRFDGKAYKAIGSAVAKADEDGNATIIPQPK